MAKLLLAICQCTMYNDIVHMDTEKTATGSTRTGLAEQGHVTRPGLVPGDYYIVAYGKLEPCGCHNIMMTHPEHKDPAGLQRSEGHGGHCHDSNGGLQIDPGVVVHTG